MKNRIILGVTALLAFALLTETAQAQWGRRGGGWRGGNSVNVETPWGSVSYGQGYYGGYYGRGPGSYGYGYYPGYGNYPRSYAYSYYPSYGYSYYPSAPAYSYYPSYTYSSPTYTYGGDSGIRQASFAPDNSSQIVLHVKVPDAKANVWVENALMSMQGVERSFISPPMTRGNTYTYTVRASWMESGKEVSKEKKIDVQPGQEYTVSFEANQPESFPAPRQLDGSGAGTQGNQHEGLVVEAGNGTLVMTDLEGNGRHSHMIPAAATITRDGKEAKLEDLREGDRIRVMAKGDGTRTVTKVEAESKANNENYKPPQRERVP